MAEKPRVRVPALSRRITASLAGPLDVSGGIAPEAAPYDPAGGGGRRSRAWRVGSFGPNAALTYALDELRRKSRDQARKNPHARSIVDRMVTNLVGTGIKPQSIARIDTTGMSKSAAKAANKRSEKYRADVAQLVWDWVDEADSTGAHDFYGLQVIAARGMVEGGETFIRLRSRRLADGLTVPLQLQVIEGDHCDHLKNDASNRVWQGIQFDGKGARTGYYLRRDHPGDGLVAGGVLNEEKLVPAEDVCHLFRALRPGQQRGEPWLAPVLQALHDLQGYLDAELVRKRVATLIAGFIKRVGDGQSPIGSSDADEEGTGDLAWEPGTLQVLAEDEDITWATPPDSGTNFEQYVRVAMRSIATGAGTLYEILSGDYGQLNDRTLRAALNDFRRSIEAYQHALLVFQFCRPVYRRFIDYALLSGALTLPEGMTRRQAYAVKWTPQAFAYIHPVQDIEAKQLEVRSGFSSRSQKVSEGGNDAEAIDAENAADNARADQLGVSYDSDGRRPKAKSPGATDGAPAPAGQPTAAD
ncbi:phage portal protein [Hansschlegelia zhihuaiae]|uniref:Phage portal protein n=1 Tax=Hansschlegelia zhihuaiae TaxID=405005 RepID=A0A4Q0M483_9HYPH|nr:phage portal protein [Hansschlegelia zhihuaiae]RXF67695.1 phage portal protein [Hansschlegelia zhihuaiae]